MCQDLVAFQAFSGKSRFTYVLLVLWALWFIKQVKGGRKERQRGKWGGKKGGLGISKGFPSL